MIENICNKTNNSAFTTKKLRKFKQMFHSDSIIVLNACEFKHLNGLFIICYL